MEMELPYDVLVQIFRYLPKSDRKAASETCHAWYLAANAPGFLKHKEAVFYKTVLNEESSPLDIFENSSIIYYNYVFYDVEITSKQNEFWNKRGEHIKSLTLSNCDICEKVFVYILQKCTNLETLNIEQCRQLFMSGRLLEGKTEGFLVNNLESLKCLNLTGNQYLTDALFSRFISAAPALEELNLTGCNLQFHGGLVNKFYPASIDIFQNPSESVLTFHFVLQLIKTRAEKIKRLYFSTTLIDGAALKSLSEVENLKLNVLKVQSCDQLTNTGILALTNHQIMLRELSIGVCSRVTDQSVMDISKNLVNLEFLDIQRCGAVTDAGIVELQKLKFLKSLNISQCELLTNECLLKGICAKENVVMESLDLNSLNIDEEGLMTISERLPRLIKFDLSYCFNAVTDTSIQVIFKNQRMLQVLNISSCDKVSDAGLTGMGKIESDDEEAGPDIPDYRALLPPRIHLGSRAEGEIVRDARRKQEVMRMCQKLASDTFSGYSLARLQKLRNLDLSGCNRITDVSLTYAFKMKELVNLNLSACQQITHKGIKHLVRNCPSIEMLNLINCYNLKDEAVNIIVKKLKRLTEIELRGCNQLTDKTLEALKLHGKHLRYLDIRGCRMSPELACSIGFLPTLHTVLMSKPSYATDEHGLPGSGFLPTLLRQLNM